MDKSLQVKEMCGALVVPRSSFYRRVNGKISDPGEALNRAKPRHPRRLSEAQESQVLETLNSERFRDKAPAEVEATLLDEGVFLCRERTMYRILDRNGQNVQRRHRTARSYTKPELLATKPNKIWSWDITKLKGPAKWSYFYLYVVMDIFSRFVVGWRVALGENSTLASELLGECAMRQEIVPGTLTVHSDRGGSMKSKTVGQLLADLGITKTHSRPYTSNDNPFSESGFKTLKYRPEFPERFGCIPDVRAFCRPYFRWYNDDHRHSGIAMLTPADVHYGRGETILKYREKVLANAYQEHPERFVRGLPSAGMVPPAVWINKPENPLEPLNSQKYKKLASIEARGLTQSTKPISGDLQKIGVRIPG